MPKVESNFQARLIRELRQMFPGCVILKNDAAYLQGMTDLLILFGSKWAALECKAHPNAKRQPNQEYYTKLLGEMSFAAFIHPDNKDQVLHDLQLAFRTDRQARVPQR